MLSAMFLQGHPLAGTIFVLFLLLTYFGFGATVTSMVFGQPSEDVERSSFHDTFATIWPIVVFALLVALLGVWLPSPLAQLLNEATSFLEMQPSFRVHP